VGKSHLAQASAEAIRAGFVSLRSIFDLVRELMSEPDPGGEGRLMTKYLKPDLLIIDDWGLKVLPAKGGEILLEIIMLRYENRRRSMTPTPHRRMGKLLCDVPPPAPSWTDAPSTPRSSRSTARSYRLQESANERTGKKAKSDAKNQSEISAGAQRVDGEPRFPKPLL